MSYRLSAASLVMLSCFVLVVAGLAPDYQLKSFWVQQAQVLATVAIVPAILWLDKEK